MIVVYRWCFAACVDLVTAYELVGCRCLVIWFDDCLVVDVNFFWLTVCCLVWFGFGC